MLQKDFTVEVDIYRKEVMQSMPKDLMASKRRGGGL